MCRDHIKIFICLLLPIVCISLSRCKCYGQAPGDKQYISAKNCSGYFPVSVKGKVVPMYVSDTDYPGVMIAVKSLQKDLRKVTTGSASLVTNILPEKNIIIIGSLGKNDMIDRLVSERKLISSCFPWFYYQLK